MQFPIYENVKKLAMNASKTTQRATKNLERTCAEAKTRNHLKFQKIST